jgi:hypothetical protein
MIPTKELFDRVRSSCREVTRRARFVRIDEDGLHAFAARLAADPWPDEDLDPAHHFRGSDDETLAFVFALDAINFGSGWFPMLRKREGLSGYRTVATACKEFFESEGAPTGARLRQTTSESMASMLGQDPENPEVEVLMRLFAQAWQDLGLWLRDGYDDRFDRVIAAAGGSAAWLVGALAQMPLYRDVAQYEELEVPLYKRAQITVADLHLAFEGTSLGRFEDLDDLTLFADNLVPHVLRCEGVLDYRESLAAHIDAEQPIEPGSLEEVEIRAVAVEAVERLVEVLTLGGRPTTAHRLDGLLWNAGQSPRIKARPRHRTRSAFY